MVGLSSTGDWTVWKDEQTGEHEVRGYGVGFVVADEKTASKLSEALEDATGDIPIEDVRTE